MKKKLFSNWGIKVISLLLAATLWFVVMYLENPPDTAVFDNITVELLNTDLLTNENRVYEILDVSNVVKRVTVSAPTDVLSGIKASDIKATADFENLTATDTIEIDFSIPALNISGQDIEGSTRVVKLSIEDRKRKTLQVRVVTIGEVAPGYELESKVADNNRIEIAGAASKVDMAEYAEATINIGNATTNISMESQIQIYDENQNLMDISSLEIGSRSTKVDAVVYATKEVPVTFQKIGTPQEGYMENGVVQGTPSKIMLAGSEAMLSSITEIHIPEEEVDITGYTQDFVLEKDIQDYLPSGALRLANDGYDGKFVIRIEIEPIQERTLNIPAGNIRFRNGLETYTPKIIGDQMTYPLVVSGLAEDIDVLLPERLYGTVDLTAWMEQEMITQPDPDSEYLIPVEFTFSSSVTIEEPMSILIQFEEVQIPLSN
ncbi:MAG: hypothetical protein LBM69_00320 [Lachnospiraceae bacterium]|nr:hypothetical protein [Lachnospiraceae bacterium]